MPRRRKDQQTPQAAPGQAYGESQDQIQAQNVIPLPNVANASPATPTAGAPPQAPGVAGGNDLSAVLAAASGMVPPQGSLFGGTNRPGEPITAGMPMGPGPGPEAMGPQRAHMRTVAETYRMLADITGSPLYRQLAQEAAAQGA